MKTDSSIDAVRLMRELRERIDREVSPMTPTQRLDYIRRSAERLSREFPLPAHAGSPENARRHAR